MKILSVSQVRAADAYTIKNEPIASIDLMERASRAFVNDFVEKFSVSNKTVKILCGLGDNGGDGLAIARMIHALGYDLEVYIIKYTDKSSDNFKINFERLAKQLEIKIINNQQTIPDFSQHDLIIDAIFGSGLSRPLEGLVKTVVEKINATNTETISVDMPSGLFADTSNNEKDTIIHASYTVSFHFPKLAFMLPQNAPYVGEWKVVDIGLHPHFIDETETKYYYSELNNVKKLIKQRNKFSHKGTFGHAVLIAGSYGMMGAAVLSAQACLRSGVGKLTVYAPKCGYEILQTGIPEAMCITDQNDNFLTKIPKIKDYNAVGVGCGIGRKVETVNMIEILLKAAKSSIVIDADALNIISENPKLLKLIPRNSILTPHPKEFQKLKDLKWNNDYQKLDKLIDFSVKHEVIVCLKGAFTAIALPDGTIHFNSSGNPGMAKAGSGDVLTGIILALLAQGYSPNEAAILGVYEHGLAGDRAAEFSGQYAMIARDIINNLRFYPK